MTIDFNKLNSVEEVRTDISSDLLENVSEFQSNFYKQFNLKHESSALQVTDSISKNYFFPTLYGNVTTSIENNIRGHKIWGLDKIPQKIELGVNGDLYTTKVFNSSAEHYLQFSVPTTGKTEASTQSTFLYSILNHQIVRSKSVGMGTYVVNKFPKTLFKRGLTSQNEYLKISGNDDMAKTLRSLMIEPKPFQMRFSTDVSSAFDVPEPNFSIEQ